MPEKKMNIRERLDALCDVKVWWRKSGVKCASLNVKDGVIDGTRLTGLASVDNAFRGRDMHQEYPGHVLYVKFHGDETTAYLLDKDGALVKQRVLLRNPDDEVNAYALWAQVAKVMVPDIGVFDDGKSWVATCSNCGGECDVSMIICKTTETVCYLCQECGWCWTVDRDRR